MAEAPEDVHTDDCLTEYTHVYSQDLLKDQVAFITGGGSGIGFRIAEVLMRHGCDTVIVSRNLEKLTGAAKKLTSATGRHCLPLQVDVRQPGHHLHRRGRDAQRVWTCRYSYQQCVGFFDAAGNFLCPATALSFNAFKTVMEIDTMGTFNTSKVIYEKWFKDHGGSIVNISATLGYKGQALQVHAGSAKAANDAMTRHLAVEWGPSGVRVNTVAPGPISGTEGYRRLGGSHAESAGIFRTIPLQRAGNKTEMAHAVLFLASRAASYVTGTTVVADGGAWLTSSNDVERLLEAMPLSALGVTSMEAMPLSLLGLTALETTPPTGTEATPPSLLGLTCTEAKPSTGTEATPSSLLGLTGTEATPPSLLGLTGTEAMPPSLLGLTCTEAKLSTGRGTEATPSIGIEAKPPFLLGLTGTEATHPSLLGLTGLVTTPPTDTEATPLFLLGLTGIETTPLTGTKAKPPSLLELTVTETTPVTLLGLTGTEAMPPSLLGLTSTEAILPSLLVLTCTEATPPTGTEVPLFLLGLTGTEAKPSTGTEAKLSTGTEATPPTLLGLTGTEATPPSLLGLTRIEATPPSLLGLTDTEAAPHS
ncbi:hypothetical protein QTP70_017340, partial [Hemibagrus guttatus]